MQFLLILLLSFTPGVLWLWFISRWDRYKLEPRSLVIRTFFWGMFIVLPVAFIEVILAIPSMISQPGGIGNLTAENLNQLSLGAMAYLAFVVAGFTEELSKFLAVRFTVFKSLYFSEPIDGVVFSAAVALGFASLENLGYLAIYGWQEILVRGPISTLGHVLFSVLWGYPLALQKMGWKWGKLLTLVGLICAMGAHGLFDFLLFTQKWYAWLTVPLFLGLVVLLVVMMRYSRTISAVRHHVAELQRKCPECGEKVPFYAGYCINCGAKLSEADAQIETMCGRCGDTLSHDSVYCTACGSRVVKKPGQIPKH
jgi:RsiW-degrading membrane proteinase PrsW (M82 family)